jgi:hypothetical protein
MGSEGLGWDISVRSFALSLSHLSMESSLNDLLQHGPQQPAIFLPPLLPYAVPLHQLELEIRVNRCTEPAMGIIQRRETA